MKDIRELRIQVTEREKFARLYDSNFLKKADPDPSQERILKIAEAAAKLGITDIRLTGGDPLERKDLPELVSRIRSINGIEKIFISTNGIFLNPVVDELKEAGVAGVDIYLDTFFEEKYIYMTGGGPIEEAMDGMEGAVRVGMKPVRINTTVIDGLTEDEILTFGQLALNEPIDVVFIERPNSHVTDSMTKDKDLSFMPIEEIRKKFKGIMKIPSRDPLAEFYKWPEAKGRIGFVSVARAGDYGAEVTVAGGFKRGLIDDDPADIREVIETGDTEKIKAAIEKLLQ